MCALAVPMHCAFCNATSSNDVCLWHESIHGAERDCSRTDWRMICCIVTSLYGRVIASGGVIWYTPTLRHVHTYTGKCPHAHTKTHGFQFYIYTLARTHTHTHTRFLFCITASQPLTQRADKALGWLRLVESIKLQVSFAEYRLFYKSFLQKRPII